MKKLLALILAAVMVLALVPMTAMADEGGTWGGIDWTLSEDGTLTISPTKGTPIPDANCGKLYEVGAWREAVRYNSSGEGKAIEGWPYDRSKVKKLVIEEGVTSIGSFVAQNMSNLQGEVVIPASVTYIGQEAFQNSTLTALTFADGSRLKCIAPGAFKKILITEVELPDGLEHIHAWAFQGCTKLEKVIIPSSVTWIGGSTHHDYGTMNGSGSGIFADCSNLKSVSFGSDEQKSLMTPWNFQENKPTPVMMAKVGLVACFDLQTALDAAAAQGEDTVTLLKDVTVPAGKEVEIPAGVTLIIPEGKTLTNNGTLTSLGTVDGGGSFTNNGTYKETAAAKIADTVEFTNNGDTALVYAVTFAADGNVVDIVAVDPGADVDLPTIPEKVGCTAVWNHDGRNITADTVIRAEYTMIPTSDPEPTPNPEAAPIPETGDGMGVYLFAGLVLISLLGMAMLRKREA